jgi:hypothetical protein
MRQLRCDPCVFLRGPTNAAPTLIIVVYVDDIIITGAPSDVTAFEAALASRFTVQASSDLRWYLGIEFIHDKSAGTLTLTQRKYVDDVLAEFGLENINPSISTNSQHSTLYYECWRRRTRDHASEPKESGTWLPGDVYFVLAPQLQAHESL